MKKKSLIAIVIAVVVCFGAVFVSLDAVSASHNHFYTKNKDFFKGTYYLYSNGKYDTTKYIKVFKESGKWKIKFKNVKIGNKKQSFTGTFCCWCTTDADTNDQYGWNIWCTKGKTTYRAMDWSRYPRQIKYYSKIYKKK